MGNTHQVRSAQEWLALKGAIQTAVNGGATVAMLARQFGCDVPTMASVLDGLQIETLHKKLKRELRQAQSNSEGGE